MKVTQAKHGFCEFFYSTDERSSDLPVNDGLKGTSGVRMTTLTPCAGRSGSSSGVRETTNQTKTENME